jgi:PhzF family phenazine biosynthesis protein
MKVLSQLVKRKRILMAEISLEVNILHAFTNGETGGNPAGVVVNKELLSSKQMQQIAAKVGCSETAFVLGSSNSETDYRIHYFTPNDEVDICGHATIAAFSLMLSKDIVKEGSYSFECRAGILNVEINGLGEVFLEQLPPAYYEIDSKDEILNSLHITSANLDDRLPIEIVSTGLKDILVPIKDLHTLNTIKPDLPQVMALCRKYNTVGYHLFTLEAERGLTAICRNFAPLYGIDEESATGTSMGALTCYLYKNNLLPLEEKVYMFEQGHALKQVSKLKTLLDVSSDGDLLVRVGGSASYIQQITVEVPCDK